MLKRLVVAVCLLLGSLTVAACDALPRHLKNQAVTLEKNIATLETTREAREKDYAAKSAAPAFAFFAPYAKRENWTGQFATAKSEIARLKTDYDARVKPLVKENDPKQAKALRTELTALEKRYATARVRIDYVNNRMTLIQNGQRNAAAWRDRVVKEIAAADKRVAAITPVSQKAKADFPARRLDIDRRFVPVKRLQDEMIAAGAIVAAQFANHTAGKADYAAFADAYTRVVTNAATLPGADKRYRDELASLSREYSLILRDMKIEYEATVGRTSWNSGSDYGEQDYTYTPVRISKADYDYLSALSDSESQGQQGNLARRYHGWGGGANNDIFIKNDVWNRLRVDMGQGWPDSYHDDSQFFLAELTPIYYHKYAEVNGKTVTEREWEEVDEDEFGRYAGDFGMAVETKKLGMFADEAVEQPIPPGMDMVGDPRYGRWVSDGNGGQRWSFLEAYALYALLSNGPGNYYTRAEYDSYRRWRDRREREEEGTGYYGGSSSPVWGSNGSATRTSASYRSSPYSAVGGVNSVPNDVRQAGARARTRGPGSSGK